MRQRHPQFLPTPRRDLRDRGRRLFTPTQLIRLYHRQVVDGVGCGINTSCKFGDFTGRLSIWAKAVKAKSPLLLGAGLFL